MDNNCLFIATLLHALGNFFLTKGHAYIPEASHDHRIYKRQTGAQNCQSVGPVDNVCVQFGYIPDQTALRATLLVGGRQVLNTVLSGRNPPPACAPIFVPIMTAACVQVRDIQIGREGTMACPEVALVNIAAIRLRCIVVNPQGVSFQTVMTPNQNGGILEVDL